METMIPVLKAEKPKKRSSRKLLYLLIVFFITMLVILFFQSSISKIAKIDIKGNELVSNDSIGQASQIAVGNHFFEVSAKTIEKRVKSLSTIETVNVSKSFPGLVTILVKEYPRVAFQIADDGTRQVLFADGSAISLQGSAIPFDKPILSGWKDDDPWKAKLCKILAEIPPALLSDISEIKPDPSPAYDDKIKMYTRSQFEVYTTVGFFADKIQYLGFAVNEMKEKNNITSGVLTLLDTDRGEPFVKDQKATDSKDLKKDPSKEPKKDSSPTVPKETSKPTNKDPQRNS